MNKELVSLVKERAVGAYNDILRSKPVTTAIAMSWQNVPMAGAELIVMSPEDSARARLINSLGRIVTSFVYETGREIGIDYLKSKGKINVNSVNNGRRKFDRLYGAGVAFVEAGINSVVYTCSGSSNFKQMIVPLTSGFLLTMFGANFNGRALDTALDANELKNEGRGYWQDKSIDIRKKRVDLYTAVSLSALATYSWSTLVAPLFYK